MESLLRKSRRSDHAIVLMDATDSRVRRFENNTRWDKALKICEGLPFRHLNLLFWNVDNDKFAFFPGGAHVVPAPVNRVLLKPLFDQVAAKIHTQCVTCTHVGFRAIPAAWKRLPNAEVFLVTDGQMRWADITDEQVRHLKDELAKEIQNLPAHFRLSIVTVEADDESVRGESTDFNGCDVYKVVMSKGLTSRISEFTSHVPYGPPVTHIAKASVDAGYVPFGDRQFPQLETARFLHLLRTHAGDSQEAQLATVQKLSGTLAHLLEHQGSAVVQGMIDQLVPLFTHIDPAMARYLLQMGFDDETKGSAALLQDFRARMTRLFQTAQRALLRDVRAATGMQTRVMSFPVKGTVVVCPVSLVTEAFVAADGTRFPAAAIRGGVPVMPVLSTAEVPLLQAQCVRQFSRAALAKLYGGDVRGDVMLYLALALNYVVQHQTAITADVKTAYRAWAKVMWLKKRRRSDVTEIASLAAGHVPVPNSGGIAMFYNLVREAAAKVGLTGAVMRLWEKWTLALDPVIGHAQQSHCVEDALYGTVPLPSPPTWKFVHLTDDLLALDYTCFITMETLDTVGGYRIPEHKGFAGLCHPRFLLSADGRAQFLRRGTTFACPLCYGEMALDALVPVGPRPSFDFGVSLKSAVGHPRSVVPPARHAAPGSVLYVLKGTVGGGKSTFAQHLARLAEERKLPVLVLSTDRYARVGTPMAQAVERVTLDLREFLARHAGEATVVISDTCNERYRKRTPVFGQSLKGFRRRVLAPNVDQNDLPGYAKWSLRNVLRRGPVGSSDGLYWLNPVDASVATCKRVHKKKFHAIWGKKAYRVPADATADSLEADAVAYERGLLPWPLALP